MAMTAVLLCGNPVPTTLLPPICVAYARRNFKENYISLRLILGSYFLPVLSEPKYMKHSPTILKYWQVSLMDITVVQGWVFNMIITSMSFTDNARTLCNSLSAYSPGLVLGQKQPFYIWLQLDWGGSVLLILLDLFAVFNLVEHSVWITIWPPGDSWYWLFKNSPQFFQGCSQRVVFGGRESLLWPLVCGLPQVFLLFNIYMHPLAEHI